MKAFNQFQFTAPKCTIVIIKYNKRWNMYINQNQSSLYNKPNGKISEKKWAGVIK